ncbi:hypothetical protein E1J38_009270 [Seonamhaeicola sediminis]|uniref:DUF4258 domain-containing protein n=1 Tax=Seonamhaeicola sediminis TaxID=2528206 RepID=A0A562YET5_9FLAO|nr:hypothetical protein [Seonamhaeicola sediminis]TWO33039.1 hypothetical protein E1J38_009270 [Seonamhaeicola sediminis]
MKLIQRLGYYLGGFSIGLIVLAFFLNGKKVSCDYGPTARVLKNINSKKIQYQNINDSTIVNHLLNHGDVDFSKSEPRKEPCAIFYIEGKYHDDMVYLIIQNCDSVASVTDLKIVQ